MKRFSEMISEGFIWGVGITRPKEGQERRAAIYITATLVGSVLAALLVFALLLRKLI